MRAAIALGTLPAGEGADLPAVATEAPARPRASLARRMGLIAAGWIFVLLLGWWHRTRNAR